MATGSAIAPGPIAASRAETGGIESRWIPQARGKYSQSQRLSIGAGSKLSKTTRWRATRTISATPAIGSGQWVDGDERHRRVEAVVFEREVFGAGLDGRGGPRGTLLDHHLRGLDRGDLAVARLVGAGAGADVEDAAGVAEGRFDPRRDPRIGSPHLAVADPDPVVGGLGHARA